MTTIPQRSIRASRWSRWLVIALLAVHQIALAGQVCPIGIDLQSSDAAAHCVQADEAATPSAVASAGTSGGHVLSGPHALAVHIPPCAYVAPYAGDSAPPGPRIPASILFCNSRQ